jgi:hypothetical protein
LNVRIVLQKNRASLYKTKCSELAARMDALIREQQLTTEKSLLHLQERYEKLSTAVLQAMSLLETFRRSSSAGTAALGTGSHMAVVAAGGTASLTKDDMALRQAVHHLRNKLKEMQPHALLQHLIKKLNTTQSREDALLAVPPRPSPIPRSFVELVQHQQHMLATLVSHCLLLRKNLLEIQQKVPRHIN